MNKETRSWATGLIAIIISNYFIRVTVQIDEHGCREIIIAIKVIFFLIFMLINAWGIDKVLKNI